MTEYTKLIELVVNDITRVITIPNNNIVLGVVGDIEVNKLMFKMPRYYCGFDMSEFTPKINYVTPNAEGNYYKSELEVTDDVITFTWLLTSDVTEHNGTVKFSISLYKKENGRVSKVFNSRSSVGNVLEGLNVDAYVTPEQQQTILDRLETEIREDIQSFVTEKEASINQQITKKSDAAIKAIDAKKNDVLSTISEDQYIQKIEQNTAKVGSLREDIVDLYAGNPKTRKKVPEKWQNGYIDTSGNLIANNTGYITQELISFDEEGYIYSLKDTFEGFASQFKLWIFIYDLSGNYVRGRNESYAVSNIGDAPKPDTQHKYRFMLSTVNWETFSDSNINADKANTILQIKKEIQNPYAKKENLNKTDESVNTLDVRVTTLENKYNAHAWKKWNAIGDSITFLDGYEPLVKNALGIESYTNNGQSGFSTPMIGADYINNMSDDYDLITFFMGTNNFGRCNSIAETKTSCESIFSAMANKWQTSDIVIILPIQRWGYTGDDVKGSQPTMTNSDGITLREYCLAIKEVAEKYTFCVLDGYYRSGIIGGENGNTSNYLSDGLHPNESGNTLIANMIVKFLKANFKVN